MSNLQQIADTETCKNIESWCDEAKPDCEESYVKEKCQKYCGLCPGMVKWFSSNISKEELIASDLKNIHFN